MAIMFPGLIMRTMTFFFSSAMRKYYTPEKLASMIKIEVCRDDHSGITVNCSELPDASVWIAITNTTPFRVVIHETEAELYLSGRVARFVKICEKGISPSHNEKILMQTDLTEKQVNYIKKHKLTNHSKLMIRMLLSCKLSPFEINAREISTKNIKFIDCNGSATIQSY